MLVPQKILFQLLIAAIAFGSVACACPVLPAKEVDSHAQHQSQTQTPAPSEACHQSDCIIVCSLVPADFSDQDAMPCNGKYPIDDLDGVPPESIAAHHPERFTARTDPPPYLWVARDTPVRRFDRLLD
jgi:hypothetical protein